MQNVIKAMVGLAALAFLLAVAGSLNLFSLMGLPPETLSRACTNLALLGIGFSLVFKES
ncbi:MAG: hypothetical protein IIB78_10065 [Proteobacteria bacterium]|nr:hypothetical protein [Pseudomonadota bacterium]MCH8058200.1 hypothetical protein [Pseudomonadota bacterium]